MRDCLNAYMSKLFNTNQVNIGMWNLDKLAVALRPLLGGDKQSQLETILRGYGDLYQKYYLQLFR